MRLTPGILRLTLVAGALYGAAAIAPPPCAAQRSAGLSQASDGPPPSFQRLAGTTEKLWITHAHDDRTSVFHRTPAGDFALAAELFGQIRSAVAGDGVLYFFLSDGQMYTLRPPDTTPRVAVNLPLRALPHALAATDHELFALCGDEAAELLKDDSDGAAPGADVSPDGPAALIAFDGRRWRFVASLPDDLRGARLSALVEIDGGIVVAGAVNGVVRTTTWRANRWLPTETPPMPSQPRGLWLLNVNGQLLLLTDVPGADRPSEVALVRKLGRVDSAWATAELRLPADPLHAIDQLIDVAGFNQHVVLAVRDGERLRLVFGRSDAEPSLSARSLDDVVSAPHRIRQVERITQIVTFGLLALILTSLFTLRRDSMIQVLQPPPGFVLNGVFPRLLSFLIDLLPFTLIAATLTGIPWREAVGTLSQFAGDTAPIASVGAWWLTSIVLYTLYATVCELLISRTLGKLLLGTIVLSEDGNRPRPWQIILRNALRLVELMPHFWIFALLVILSRNRQRLGDVFARTYVVRRVPPVLARPSRRETRDNDDAGSPGDDNSGKDESDQR